jgi:hypothetical protein
MAEAGPEHITAQDSSGAGRVVVGYDGRWQAPIVLDFAADVAARSHRPLSIVTLYRSPDDVACLEGRPADGWHPQAVIRHTLEAAAAHVRHHHPSLRVAVHALRFDGVFPDDEPFCSARLLVLGERRARSSGSGSGSGSASGCGTAGRVLRAAVTCDVVVVQEAEASVS